ncbi:hypothetical protein [Rhizobium sullae]|nr:hypothetical protein [Rhizobium sullae]
MDTKDDHVTVPQPASDAAHFLEAHGPVAALLNSNNLRATKTFGQHL